MSDTVSARRVLVIGLDPFRVPGPWDPAPVAEAIEAGMSALADRGFDAEACLVGLDGSDDVEARVTEVLGGPAWDCVLVGAGIRRSEELLGLFSSIVNLVHRHAPGAVIAFNSTPDDLAEAVLGALSGSRR